MKRARLDPFLRWMFTAAMAGAMAINLVLWGQNANERLIVECAGLVWLIVLWLRLTRRQLGVQEAASLVCYIAFSAMVWNHIETPSSADGWVVFAVTVGIGAFLPSNAGDRRPRRKIVKVTAPNLTGTIERGGTYASATLVQEFSDDWETQLSAVVTDPSGRFDLPQASEEPTHYIAFSHPGTEICYLAVTIVPDAPPLSIRLRPRSG